MKLHCCLPMPPRKTPWKDRTHVHSLSILICLELSGCNQSRERRASLHLQFFHHSNGTIMALRFPGLQFIFSYMHLKASLGWCWLPTGRESLGMKHSSLATSSLRLTTIKLSPYQSWDYSWKLVTFDPSALFREKKNYLDCVLINFSFFLCCSFSHSSS